PFVCLGVHLWFIFFLFSSYQATNRREKPRSCTEERAVQKTAPEQVRVGFCGQAPNSLFFSFLYKQDRALIPL
ncbi:MAG: hypothetical protein LBP69_00035, partial [Treponema sp.]|nr:hypothetical protein [Treponema sp.]